MSLGFPISLNAGTTNGSDTRTSGSFTPTANRLLIVAAAGRRASPTPSSDFGITDSASLFWTEIGQDTGTNGTTNPSLRMGVWASRAPETPAAMTVTCQSINAAEVGLVVMEVPDAEVFLSRTGLDGSTSGDPTVVLASSISGLGLHICSWTGIPGSITATSGGTELLNITGSGLQMVVRYDLGTTGTTSAWQTTAARGVAAFLQVEELAVATELEVALDLDPAFARQIVAARGLTETIDLAMTFGVSNASTASPENPAQTWRSATRTWRMPEGTEPVAGTDLTFS